MSLFRLKIVVIGIAPCPFIWIWVGLDDGMARFFEMFLGMFAGGRGAAADMSAGLASPEGNPFFPGFQPFFTAICFRLNIGILLAFMWARFKHK